MKSLCHRHNIVYRATVPANERAFSLVELLVVIGIIALLIAILLPVLAGARRSAQRTVCEVRLQQIMIAAQAHAADHQGFYPLAGWVGNLTPAGLADSNQTHYDYCGYTPSNEEQLLAPMTVALAKEMSFGSVLGKADSATIATLEQNPQGFIRNFRCPSQGINANEFPGPMTIISGTDGVIAPVYYPQTISYVFNEAVVGYEDMFGRLRGNSARVKQPSRTMFAADGLGGSTADNGRTGSYDFSSMDTEIPMATVYNNFAASPFNNGPITLGDAFSGQKYNGMVLAGDYENFILTHSEDLGTTSTPNVLLRPGNLNIRHLGKINVAFCDGHVETINITYTDLSKVYLIVP